MEIDNKKMWESLLKTSPRRNGRLVEDVSLTVNNIKHALKEQGLTVDDAGRIISIETQCPFMPKFIPPEVGEWVVNNNGEPQLFQVTLYSWPDSKIKGAKDNLESFISTTTLNRQYHLWTIQDAKSGDVLEFGDHGRLVVGIVSYVNKRTGKVDVNCLLEDNKFKVGNFYTLDTINPRPATKERRDLLFRKMHEAGYEWDAEKKELKNTEQKHISKHKVGDTIYYNSFGEIKSMIIANVVTDGTDNPMYEDEKGNAVFEKDLIEQKWSEEDEKYLKLAIDNFQTLGNSFLTAWLKSLKDRVQSQNLTVTDEELIKARNEAYNDALDKLEYHSDTPTFNDGWSAAIWYLKKRNAQLHNTWKPSNEQMERLKGTINSLPHQEVLYSLYQDLKKLMEE